MMGRLRAMREPLKYVQGRDALLKFHEEMGYMGKRWLFVCSNSGYKACHDKIEKSFPCVLRFPSETLIKS
jgi:glycerol dehydrogenase